MLKYETITTRRVDYSDIDTLIRETFRCPDYECVVYQEWNNGELHSFRAEPQEMNKEKLLSVQTNWTARRFNLADMLNHCCFHKLIEPGEYEVKVFW